MALPQTFKARRLRRYGFALPFVWAFTPLAIFLVGTWLVDAYEYPYAALVNFGDYIVWKSTTIGPAPFVFSAILAVVGLFAGLGYAKSTQQILATQLGVRPLGPESDITRRVHAMAQALGLPRPQVYSMRDANAYAIGSSAKTAAVVLGRPLLDQLPADEVDAIIGHELGHIVSGDMRRMQMAAGFQSMLDTLTGAAAKAGAEGIKGFKNAELFAFFLLMLSAVLRFTIFIVSELLMKRLARKREFVADAFGVLVTSPEAMSRALKKVAGSGVKMSEGGEPYACLMFFTSGGNWLATHPSLERRLQSLENGQQLERLVRIGMGERFSQVQKRMAKAVSASRSAGSQVGAQAKAGLAQAAEATGKTMEGLSLLGDEVMARAQTIKSSKTGTAVHRSKGRTRKSAMLAAFDRYCMTAAFGFGFGMLAYVIVTLYLPDVLSWHY